MGKEAASPSSKHAPPTSLSQKATSICDDIQDELIQKTRTSEPYEMMREKLFFIRRKASKYEQSDSWFNQILAAVDDCLNIVFETKKENADQPVSDSGPPNCGSRYWAISQAMLDWYSDPEPKDDSLPWTRFLMHIFAFGCLAERLDSKYQHMRFESALSGRIEAYSKQSEIQLIQGLKVESDQNRLTGTFLEFMSKASHQYQFSHLKELVESHLTKKQTGSDHKPKQLVEGKMLTLPQPRVRNTPKSPALEDSGVPGLDPKVLVASSRVLPAPFGVADLRKATEAPLYVPPRASSQAGPEIKANRAGMSQLRTHIQTEGVSSARATRKEKKLLQVVETIRDLPMIEAEYRLRNLKKITLPADQFTSSSAKKILPVPQLGESAKSEETPLGGSVTSATPSDQRTVDLDHIHGIDDSIIAFGTPEQSQPLSKPA